MRPLLVPVVGSVDGSVLHQNGVTNAKGRNLLAHGLHICFSLLSGMRMIARTVTTTLAKPGLAVQYWYYGTMEWGTCKAWVLLMYAMHLGVGVAASRNCFRATVEGLIARTTVFSGRESSNDLVAQADRQHCQCDDLKCELSAACEEITRLSWGGNIPQPPVEKVQRWSKRPYKSHDEAMEAACMGLPKGQEKEGTPSWLEMVGPWGHNGGTSPTNHHTCISGTHHVRANLVPHRRLQFYSGKWNPCEFTRLHQWPPCSYSSCCCSSPITHYGGDNLLKYRIYHPQPQEYGPPLWCSHSQCFRWYLEALRQMMLGDLPSRQSRRTPQAIPRHHWV